MGRAQQSKQTTALGQLVASRRAALDLGYHAVAKLAGVSANTVYKIENARLTRAPQRRTLELLSVALQVPLESLLNAAAADMGQVVYDLSDEKRKAIYISMRELTDEEIETVQAVVNALRGSYERGTKIRKRHRE
jgi:transcriptional regulator with XRE-family HTH domain